MIRHWVPELLHKIATDYMSCCGFILYGGGKSKAPKAPDYAAAAVAQGQANLESARATAKLNNPNIINPYGTQTVTYGGEPTFDAQGYDKAYKQYEADLASYNANPYAGNSFGGNAIGLGYGVGGLGGRGSQQQAKPRPIAPDKNSFWRGTGDPDIGTVRQVLSPAEQAIYDKNVQQRTNIGDVGITGSAALKDIIGQKIDLSGAPTVGDGAATRNKSYDALMARVNEDTANSRDQRNSQLIAAGIRPGTKAYDDAQNLITRGYNDARGNAEINAGNAAEQQFGIDTKNRQQYIAEMLAQRQTPLNEINALMSGSQVNNPFANGIGYQGGANVQAAPIFSAAQQQGQADLNAYNAQQAGANSMMGGLFSLGAAGITGWSDRRLKRNIVKIGEYLNGLAKYSFTYIWGEKAIGAMADEVEKLIPEAVITHPSGYKMVDYAMVGE